MMFYYYTKFRELFSFERSKNQPVWRILDENFEFMPKMDANTKNKIKEFTTIFLIKVTDDLSNGHV